MADFSKGPLPSAEYPSYELQPHGPGSAYPPPTASYPYGGQQPAPMMSGQQQQQATTVVATQPQQMASSVVVVNDTNYDSRSFMWMSAATCFLCFWPIGIIALVFSSISRSHFQRGDEAQGKTCGFIALGINIFNIVGGIIFIIVLCTVILPGIGLWTI
ncbi:cysteine-rich and transmembrane domain-containing protein 1-like [Oscarella lobularis]|uniref:cysteine-rich and transmembrane domain-containing protein 1-like n=1 Tax=Oscarella lobularis TaxID=121494 RepID=UPI0033136A69